MTHEAFPQPPTENQDALLDNDLSQHVALLHDVEVIARSIDMVPARSDLGRYLASPAIELEKGEDGHTRTVEADYSNGDRFKQDTEVALGAVKDGKIGRIRLMSGMVNAHHDAHKGSATPNLRYAFEDLHHLSITGNSGFHSMMNPEGRTIGALEYDGRENEVADANVTLLADGAAAILDGERAVMFDAASEHGSRHKMYGLTDPQTGERLQNAFLMVGGGTFKDKDGSTSNFSNIAWADLVLIPDEKIAEVKQAKTLPEDVEQPEFDIDKVDWEPFQHPTFKVKRTGGKVDEGGWNIKQIKLVDRIPYAVITSWNNQHGGIQKTIPLDELISWQNEEN